MQTEAEAEPSQKHKGAKRHFTSSDEDEDDNHIRPPLLKKKTLNTLQKFQATSNACLVDTYEGQYYYYFIVNGRYEVWSFWILKMWTMGKNAVLVACVRIVSIAFFPKVYIANIQFSNFIVVQSVRIYFNNSHYLLLFLVHWHICRILIFKELSASSLELCLNFIM